MKLIEGKKVAEELLEKMRVEVAHIRERGGKIPHLAAILVGNDGASETYVAAKVKACERVGFKSTLIRLPAAVSEKDLLEKVDLLNRDSDIDGFIVQLPLPET